MPSRPTPSTLADEEGGQGSVQAGFDAGGTLDVVGEDNRRMTRSMRFHDGTWWVTTLPPAATPRLRKHHLEVGCIALNAWRIKKRWRTKRLVRRNARS